MWRNRYGGGFGPVVRQNTEWMNNTVEMSDLKIYSSAEIQTDYLSRTKLSYMNNKCARILLKEIKQEFDE